MLKLVQDDDTTRMLKSIRINEPMRTIYEDLDMISRISQREW